MPVKVTYHRRVAGTLRVPSATAHGVCLLRQMPDKSHKNLSPRINNRKALHDYHIDAKLECGLALRGSEVKSLRDGTAQLHEAFARIENGELWLYGLHND